MLESTATIYPTGMGLEAQHAELAHRVQRQATADGVSATPIPGFAIMRLSAPTPLQPTVYEPCICIVVQGRKQAVLADEYYVYDPLNYLVVSMALPISGQVIEATRERPYLCLRIDIDAMEINKLLQQLPISSAWTSPPPTDNRALFLARTSAPLLDAVLRLVRLLDTPEEAAILAPLALREIHYRVLTGELGQRLCDLCAIDGQAQRIARVITLLKARYDEPLRMEELAAAAHLSVSALHHRFKAVTAMSPLQYQKQLRLQEARRLMLSEGLEAAAAGHRVGYESPSQFSREYRRLFGAPPRAETQRQRIV